MEGGTELGVRGKQTHTLKVARDRALKTCERGLESLTSIASRIRLLLLDCGHESVGKGLEAWYENLARELFFKYDAIRVLGDTLDRTEISHALAGLLHGVYANPPPIAPP